MLALRESGVVRKNGANPDELLATRPAVRWEAVQPNIPDLSHHNNLIEKLTRRNVELENQVISLLCMDCLKFPLLSDSFE